MLIHILCPNASTAAATDRARFGLLRTSRLCLLIHEATRGIVMPFSLQQKVSRSQLLHACNSRHCKRSSRRRFFIACREWRLDSSCRETRSASRQAPEGRKDNSPGRAPGVGPKSTQSHGGATENGCGKRSFAPAGAHLMQCPIRGLTPPAIIFAPLRGRAGTRCNRVSRQ